MLAVGYIKSKFVIMYSSNIGLYYKFEKLIGVVERFKPGTKTSEGREVVFVFVGAKIKQILFIAWMPVMFTGAWMQKALKG